MGHLISSGTESLWTFSTFFRWFLTILYSILAIEILPGCAGVCCVGVQGQDSETGGGEGEGISVLPCRDYLH